MIPIRFVATALQCDIQWEHVQDRIEIIATKETAKTDQKNIHAQQLVDQTECSKEVLEFRKKDNPRRNGLLKQE